MSGRKGGAWQQRVVLVLVGQGDEKDKSAHLAASWCLSQTTDSMLDTWKDLGDRQRKHALVTVRHKKKFLSYPKSIFAE